LEAVLSSKYDSEELRDRIHAFNLKVVDLCCHHLKQLEQPVPPEVRQHLARLFLDDTHCDFFFQHYGGIQPNHELAASTNGRWSRLPGGGASRYYVMTVNHFTLKGGFTAIINRLKVCTR
jgi:hypothetical protein